MGLSTGSESAFDEVMTIKHMRFRKRRLFNERGVSLPLALVALAFGVLLVTPMLSSVNTNLTASQAVDQNMKRLYASDAGVEYAIWKLSDDADFRDTLVCSTVVVTAPTTVNGIVLTAMVQ